MTGNIITIEGLDGAGKSTQIKLLSEHLEAQNIKHQFIHFPMLNKGEYGNLIAEYLRGEYGSLEEVHPKLVALLFAEDRKEHKATLENWLSNGYTIIMDRYVKSNIVFQCAKTKDPKKKEALKQWILDFEFTHNNLPKPHISFFLNVPFSQIEQTLKNNRVGADRDYLKGKIDIHEDSIKLQKNVLNEYLVLLKEQPNFFEINCSSREKNWLDPLSIHEAIKDKISLFDTPVYAELI